MNTDDVVQVGYLLLHLNIPPFTYTNTSNKPRMQKSVKIQGAVVGMGDGMQREDRC